MYNCQNFYQSQCYRSSFRPTWSAESRAGGENAGETEECVEEHSRAAAPRAQQYIPRAVNDRPRPADLEHPAHGEVLAAVAG